MHEKNVLEIREIRGPMTIPSGIVARHIPSGTEYSAGQTLVRRHRRGFLVLYRPVIEVSFPDIRVTTGQMGLHIWCDLKIAFADAVAAHTALGQAAVTVQELQAKVEPIVRIALESLGRELDIVGANGRRQAEKRLQAESSLLSGLVITSCLLRNVETIVGREEKLRLWLASYLKLLEIRRDSRMSARAIREVEERYQLDLLTAKERHRPAAERLDTMLSLLSGVDEIRFLSTVFYAEPLKERRKAAAKLREIAHFLDLTDILALCSSGERGKRVAGYIALGANMRLDERAGKSRTVTRAIAKGLTDNQSRVRYRAVQAAGENRTILTEVIEKLELLSKEEPNHAVRDLASRLLQSEASLKRIQTISKDFYGKPRSTRNRTVRTVRTLAKGLNFDAILSLCKSTQRGRRVAGFIALSVSLEAEIPEAELGRIAEILEFGLKDRWLKARYRALQVTTLDANLARRHAHSLKKLASNERNKVTRDLAKKVLEGIERSLDVECPWCSKTFEAAEGDGEYACPWCSEDVVVES